MFLRLRINLKWKTLIAFKLILIYLLRLAGLGKVEKPRDKMETNFDSFSSAFSSANIDSEIPASVCCGTCDCYHDRTPSGEVAVMTYCSLRKQPVNYEEVCKSHPQYTGGVSL